MTTQTPVFEKSIRYDRFSKDYEMKLNGDLVGYARTHTEAENTLDALVHELLTHPIPVVEVIEAHRDTLADSADIAAMLAEEAAYTFGDRVVPANPDGYHLIGVVVGFINPDLPESYLSVNFECSDGTTENLWLTADELQKEAAQ